jgi:hypothetical protein
MKATPFPSKTTPWRVQLPVRFSAEGKRKAYYFSSKEEAEKFASKAKKLGPAAVTDSAPLSKIQRDRFSIATDELAKLFDGDVTKLYAAAERIKKLQNVKSATVRQAVELFQAWRQAQAAAGKISKSTVDADRWRLLKLIEAFSEIQLADLTPVVLREFFDEASGDPRSVYKSVRIFFGWALERGYLGENPMATIKPAGDYGVNNEYYPVETFGRMLRIAAGLEPAKAGGKPTRAFADMLPWFLLSGFLGLRSCEAFRLNRGADAIRWTDLHFDAKVPNVEIRQDVAKQTARDSDVRHVETAHYLEAFKAWESFIPRKGPHICAWTKRQFQELKRDFKKATGIKFIENGFRNSFATYALTFNELQGLGKLALEMGNSEAICKRHYVKNIAPGSGEAWFNLRPFEIVPAAAAMGGLK